MCKFNTRKADEKVISSAYVVIKEYYYYSMEIDKHPVFVDKYYHLISTNYGTKTEHEEWANNALESLVRLKCLHTPYLKLFMENSGRSSRDYDSLKDQLKCDDTLTEKIISHNYQDGVAIVEKMYSNDNYNIRKLELIAELYFLDKKFKQLEELEYRISNFPIDFVKIRQDELDSLRRIKLIFVMTYWCKGNFSECSMKFFNFLEEDPGLIKFIASMDSSTNNISKHLLSKEEITACIIISTIVYIPLDNYDIFLYLEDMKEIFDAFPLLRTSLKLLVNTNFRHFISILNSEIKCMALSSPFLYDHWKSISLVMMSKIFYFYLRISTKLKISYLSTTLDIEYEIVKEQITQLIEAGHLNFDVVDDTITFSPKHAFVDIGRQLTENFEIINGLLEEKNVKMESIRSAIQETIQKNHNTSNIEHSK